MRPREAQRATAWCWEWWRRAGRLAAARQRGVPREPPPPTETRETERENVDFGCDFRVFKGYRLGGLTGI